MNTKGTDETARKRRLICAFVVAMQNLKSVFSRIEPQLLNGYGCFDKNKIK